MRDIDTYKQSKEKGGTNMNYYERAQELNEETIANRRYFHTNAEVGLDMPKAKAYVMKKLAEYGLEPKECGYGVTDRNYDTYE